MFFITSANATPSALYIHYHSKEQILSYTALPILSISIIKKELVLCEVRAEYFVLFYWIFLACKTSVQSVSKPTLRWICTVHPSPKIISVFPPKSALPPLSKSRHNSALVAQNLVQKLKFLPVLHTPTVHFLCSILQQSTSCPACSNSPLPVLHTPTVHFLSCILQQSTSCPA